MRMFRPGARASHTIMAMSVRRDVSAPAIRPDVGNRSMVPYRTADTSYCWLLPVDGTTRPSEQPQTKVTTTTMKLRAFIQPPERSGARLELDLDAAHRAGDHVVQPCPDGAKDDAEECIA